MYRFLSPQGFSNPKGVAQSTPGWGRDPALDPRQGPGVQGDVGGSGGRTGAVKGLKGL